MKYFSLKAFDGTIVRVEESKVKTFMAQQEKIKKMLSEGKSLEEIKMITNKGMLFKKQLYSFMNMIEFNYSR